MNPSPTDPRPDLASLRIVLFGVPEAGKSSLLNSLQSVAVQNHKRLQGHLDGNLVPPTIPDSVNPPDVIVYPLTWQPITPPGLKPVPLSLVDCNGEQCNQLINHRADLTHNVAAGSLSANVLEADALILVVDGTSPDAVLHEDFVRFARFLRYLRDYRSRSHTVGGLPVWLTLTKCDQLRLPEDTRRDWEARVKARSESVAKQFADFLADDADDNGMLGFGSLSMKIATTAVRKPAFGDVPGDDPMGIPELFHDAIVAAQEYDERQNRASRRLKYTMAGAAGLLGVLLAAGAAFYASPNEGVIRPVQTSLDLFRLTDSDKPSERLKGDLARRVAELQKLEADPEFALLDPKEQNYVRTRREELESYARWYENVRKVADPSRMRTIKDLETLEGQLLRELAPPEKHASEWATTDGVLLRNRLLRELPALISAARELRDYFGDLRKISTKLLFTDTLPIDWNSSVESLLSPKKPPFAEADPERGAAWSLAEVATSRQDFETSLERLRIIREMATAAGLIPGAASVREVLTAAPLDPNDYLKSTSARLASLKREFPNYGKWRIENVPDGIRPTLKRRLAEIYTREVRESKVMLDLQRGPDTLAGWQKLAEVLTTSPLADWRDWIGTLAKLADDTAEDPAAALSSFIRQPGFEVSLNSLRLKIPQDLDDAKVKPSGRLTIRYGPDEKKLGEMSFALNSDGASDRENFRNYIFKRDETTPGKFTWRPGDVLYAELDITEDGVPKKMTWSRGRSLIWQIARLREVPQIHLPGKIKEGMPAVGVAVIEEGTWPTIPVLLRAGE